MKTNQVKMYFNDGVSLEKDFEQFYGIISDKGSRYAVSGGRVKNRDEVKKFLKRLKSKKKYARATHNTWAARISHEGKIYSVKHDDGETGAGMVMLRILEKRDVVDTIVVVTRWYGGVKLGNDRYKHVQDSVLYFLKKVFKT